MTLSKRVMIRLNPDIYKELERVAEYNDRKPSTLARILIENALGCADDHLIVFPSDSTNGHPAADA